MYMSADNHGKRVTLSTWDLFGNFGTLSTDLEWLDNGQWTIFVSINLNVAALTEKI